ncbi:3'(2'),5'-bisphosphate nucleotidase [Photobacterium angustum]|uniref:3'(2'),5'-bisphosphate nucleotidase CysQ n=2 Tax=Photobacterium angustum TaxID=661 RepID=A0A855S798_PHOAN|nr:adenosine-3'(2'),5'-bisphosphate nucleotidase [Photobacterium damselae subsp. damselae]KJG27766.1 adenosine-3'(2'),5'-bisphosphate nucleotidase [Photobacterium angustum]KJG35617.1 adenosine-3'(2'),5'-bisphosphate nucleotidase [Photobacterium angustum]KJG44758.1 adenosine-3'(2'),5'-bisphosphate nucleotidase [Photobacterium angustum]KJG47962.1 adenosine-3'(2'),5'-bisphosphate nucleotidase [Photobacterium angustum]
MAMLLDEIYSIALEAGAAIMARYHGQVQITQKSDSSPVTDADLAANELIVTKLQQLTPEIPILSEESAHTDWQQRQNWGTFWLVDPLDGTKEFIRKNGEFTVNISLIKEGRPVLGVVYAPALEKAWLGDGEKAWLETKAGREPIRVRAATVPTIVGSRSHPSPELDHYLEQIGEHKMTEVGSSLKFCLVAEGRAQRYPRLGPTMMWDTAAGQCVAESAGAIVLDLEGQPLNYHREQLLNPSFIVSIKD